MLGKQWCCCLSGNGSPPLTPMFPLNRQEKIGVEGSRRIENAEDRKYREKNRKKRLLPRLSQSLQKPLLFRIVFIECDYSMISVTTPDPTVLPPSLIAKRSPSSIAIGVISLMDIVMLSPGMHISVPSGRVRSPVTSVVLK